MVLRNVCCLTRLDSRSTQRGPPYLRMCVESLNGTMYALCNEGHHSGNSAVMPVLLASLVCTSKACDQDLLLGHIDSVPAIYKGQTDEAINSEWYVCMGAVADDVWQDIPLGLDPRVQDLLGNSVALNTTASVKQDEESSKPSTIPAFVLPLGPC